MKPVKARVEIYDWLRGLASLAVVLGHLKPAPKIYFMWAVNLFVIVTVALISRSKLTTEKFTRRIAYLVFVYSVTVLLFHGIASYFGEAVPIRGLFFDPHDFLVQNPYLGNLWYIALYLQILVFMFVAQKYLKNWSAATVIAVTLLFSQAMFFFTHYVLYSLQSILLPAWVLVMALGIYFAPQALEAIERAARGRFARAMSLLGFLVIFYASASLLPWFEPSENRTFVLNTFLFCIVYWFLAEVYFFVKDARFLTPAKNFVLGLSRFTLIIYLSHSGFAHLLAPLDLNPWVWTILTVAVTFLYAKILHGIYLRIEEPILDRMTKMKPSGVPLGAFIAADYADDRRPSPDRKTAEDGVEVR